MNTRRRTRRQPTTAHTVEIETSWLSAGLNHGRHEWRARCSCGWEGPWRRATEMAERDLARHLAPPKETT